MKREDCKPEMKVQVVRKTENDNGEWDNDWVDEMVSEVGSGRVFTVEGVSDSGVRFKESPWRWDWASLELAEVQGYVALRPFTAEDLREAGACDSGIEEFIRHFGFTKPVPITAESIAIMESIPDCISFLLRKDLIAKVAAPETPKKLEEPEIDWVTVGSLAEAGNDILVEVRDQSSNPWFMRYFAGYDLDSDFPFICWLVGSTRVTSKGEITAWKHCRLVNRS